VTDAEWRRFLERGEAWARPPDVDRWRSDVRARARRAGIRVRTVRGRRDPSLVRALFIPPGEEPGSDETRAWAAEVDAIVPDVGPGQDTLL
jgi:hypothetical protein